jgi:hypothetical protein
LGSRGAGLQPVSPDYLSRPIVFHQQVVTDSVEGIAVVPIIERRLQSLIQLEIEDEEPQSLGF